MTTVIDVRSHGAAGDGRTDDTAALNAALRAVHDGGGGTVFLPAGTYCISASLGRADTLARVFLTGDGERASTIMATADIPPIAGVWSESRIENLVIDAGGHGSPGVLAEFDKSYLRHCRIRGWTDFGVRLNPTTDGLLNWIDDNFVEQGPGYGIHTTHHFYDSWIVNNNVGSTGPNLSVESGPLRIIGNHLNGTPTHNIELRGNKNLTIVANICEGARREAIIYTMPPWLESDAPHVQIVANNITNGGKGAPDRYPAIGVYARDATHRVRGFTITGNLFACEDEGSGWSHAVSAEHVDDLSVCGNLWGERGFAVSAVRGTISENTVARVVATVGDVVELGAAPGTDYVYFLAEGARPAMPAAQGNTNRYTLKNIGPRKVVVAGITVAPGDAVDLVSDGSLWQQV